MANRHVGFLRWSTVAPLLAALLTVPLASSYVGAQPRGGGPTPAYIPAGYNDHQNMMDQLGIKALRPGKSGQNQTGKGFDEATANDWMGTLPDVLTMKDGTKVTTKEQWPKRRAEIVEDFEREVYGRIPKETPKVTWTAGDPVQGTIGTVAIITRTLTGAVDNSAFPQITVNIQASFTVPADAADKSVPILLEFGGAGRGGSPAAGSWQAQAIAHGWGYGFVNPGSIQADAGGNQLRQGIIGLVNKGEPRKPEDWGALRAWQWGVSRVIDYFEANPSSKVDPKKVAIEGVSRYGKAAIVTEAFEPRVAVAFVASSGEGGAKLHRHDYGEAVENLTADEYYWMGGNFLKYGASDIKGQSLNASNIPVDSHELIALCAPRLCFISHGIPNGDPAWIDAHGAYMAGALATPVYVLFGEKGFGNADLYKTDPKKFYAEPIPPVSTLVGGELAWRQHNGGHTSVPNFPAFFDWIGTYITSPSAPKKDAPASAPH